MKNRIGNIAGVLVVVSAFWAYLGIYGISIGSTDECTNSFRAVIPKCLIEKLENRQ